MIAAARRCLGVGAPDAPVAVGTPAQRHTVLEQLLGTPAGATRRQLLSVATLVARYALDARGRGGI